FFVLGDLLFVTDNVDHFETFRVLNLSSGAITATAHKVTRLLPGVSSNTLLWAFLYDAHGGNCRLPQLRSSASFDPERYCARVVNMRGTVVARLSNQRFLFLSTNNGKFVEVTDTNNFLEMRMLIKHLDKYGLVSSLTFAQDSIQFVSTHYGRHAQVCLTKER